MHLRPQATAKRQCILQHRLPPRLQDVLGSIVCSILGSLPFVNIAQQLTSKVDRTWSFRGVLNVKEASD